MPTPYKIEVFDREIDYRSHTAIGSETFNFDYLTLKKTIIEIPIIEAIKGDYVHVTDIYGNVKYQGTIADVEEERSTVKLSFIPLLSLFDRKVYYDRTYLATGTLEGFIAQIITNEFISNSDTLQNITGLSVQTLTSTYGTSLDLESNVGELYSIITGALSAYGIVVTVELKPQSKQLEVKIGKPSTTVVNVEADLDNCIERKFVIGDSYGAVNKMILINQDDEEEQVTYYLHTDGTVSTTDENRVTPVFCTTVYIPSRDFEEKAEEKAVQTLTPQQYDNLIELTYRKDDRLLDIENMDVGTLANIYSGGNTYKSLLTGYEKSEYLAKLLFGIVRVDLTDKLIIEKRTRNSGAVYATAEQGAAADAAWSPDNQGAGSGLDADKLDGYHASNFRTTSEISSTMLNNMQGICAYDGGNIDCDTTGYFIFVSHINTPGSKYGFVMNLYFSSTTNNRGQIFFDYMGQLSGHIYYRYKNSGTWSAWRDIG